MATWCFLALIGLSVFTALMATGTTYERRGCKRTRESDCSSVDWVVCTDDESVPRVQERVDLGSQSSMASGLSYLDETVEEALFDEELSGDDMDGDLEGSEQNDDSSSDGLALDETMEEAIFNDELCNSDSPQGNDQPDKTEGRPKGNEPEYLFKGSNVTVFEAHLMVFQFALKNHLTTQALSQLLLLLKVLLPHGNQLPRSVYMLKSFFLRAYPDLKVVEHQYCCRCHTLITDSEHGCTNSLCTSDTVNRFVTVPLEPQLKEMMQDESLWNALQQRLKRAPSSDIRDIYDGEKYKEHKEFLSNSSHLSLLLNTDGVAIFRSSKSSLWPIWLVVNELPKHLRFLRRNMILAGLWFDQEKPTMTTFLKPVIEEVNKLYHHGVDVNTPVGVRKLRCTILLAAVDLPARAIVLNMKQFNGKHGCSFCIDEGVTRPGAPLHRYWPPTSQTNRTHLSILDSARKATTDHVPVKGILGASILCIHQLFDLAQGCVVDNLHALYLGVTLALLKLWFNKEYRNKDFSLYSQIKACNSRLLGIAVPDLLSRTPKSLEDLHWKGSELQAWTLYFSLPVLRGILPLVYYQHWAMLVAALCILNSDNITSSDMDTAHQLLLDFYQKFPGLYGETKCTMNVHLLSHLCDCVKNWGPLWCYSCFPFETRNADLKRLYHGTRNMSKQMAFSYVWTQVIPRIPTETPVSSVQALRNVLFGRKSIKKQQIGNSYIVGGTTITLPSPEVANLLKTSGRIRTFYRVLTEDGQMFYSAKYGRTKVRNSYTITFWDENQVLMYGQIQYFTIFSGLLVAVTKVFDTSENIQDHFELTFRWPSMGPVPVRPSCVIKLVPVDTIKEKCIFIDVGNYYIARFTSQISFD